MLRVVNHNVYRTEMTYLADDADKIECSLNYIYTIEDQIKNKYPQANEDFVWDPENSSKEIQFSPDFRHALLHEPNYYFRTITSNTPFFTGIHYWEIIADGRTEHELKIGVTT